MGTGWFEGLELPAHTGGLVILGPAGAHLPVIVSLLEHHRLESVAAEGARLADWLTSPNEVLIVTRHVSGLIRSGKTVLLHLDSHIDTDVLNVPAELCDFICWRLGNVMLGLADQPSYVVAHGPATARGLIEAVGDDEPPTIGAIGDGVEAKRLTDRTMFSGLLVAETPLSPEAAELVDAVAYFESRRS